MVINDSSSERHQINAGVPQGSVLGLLLFLVYVNDIVNEIETNISLFADDTSLIEIIQNDDIISSFNKIDRDLSRLSYWAKKWRVTFNEL